MPAAQTSEGQDTKIYFAAAGDTAFQTLFGGLTGSASPTVTEAASVTNALAKAFTVAAQELGEVLGDIGDQAQTANTREYGVYGSPVRRKRATPASIDDWTCEYALDRTIANHKKLMDLAISTYVVFVLKTETSPTNITWDVISGELGGKVLRRPLATEAGFLVTVAPAVAPYYLDEA